MCNLYRLTKNADEMAHLFDAVAQIGGNAGAEIYPGYPGLVVAEGRIATMNWGFPFVRKGARGQPLKPKPINNARADKLAGGFWRPSFLARRCLIPLEAFAEAEGEKGAKTRTWLSLRDEPVFAAAGIWRDSAEWGACFSMVMTEACVDMDGIHDRMPVILAPDDYRAWLHGAPEEAHAQCRPFAGPMRIERTAEPWAGARKSNIAL